MINLSEIMMAKKTNKKSNPKTKQAKTKRKSAVAEMVIEAEPVQLDLSNITTRPFTASDSPHPMDISELGKGGCVKFNTDQIELTHDRAIEFLEMDEFVGERLLRNRQVTILANAMKRGTFRSELVDIITCDLRNQTYRMNGQHTCWARLELPADMPCQVDLIEYKAKTEYDMRQLYSSIDRGGARTVSNVIASYICGTKEYDGISARAITKATEGMSSWLWESTRHRTNHDADEKSVLMLADHYDVAHKICVFLDGHNTRDNSHIWRAPVIAAMFATISNTPRVARDFWAVVATGVGIGKSTDPRLKLRNLLQRVAINYGAGARSDTKKIKMGSEEVYRLCIHAWNAFRDDRDIRMLKAPLSTSRPKVSK